MVAAKEMSVVVIIISTLTVLVCRTSAIPVNRESRSVIYKLNGEGPYIGLITTYPPEEKAFFATAAFHPHPRHPFVDLSGRRFRIGKIHGKSVIYLRSGIGMRNAAAATQQLVDLFDLVGIVHFGIAGNVNSSLSIGDVTVPKFLAHTGMWKWLKINGTVDTNSVARLDVGSYNLPKARETKNLLGRIGYEPEEFYSETAEPDIPRDVLWAETTPQWLHLAMKLQGIELVRCLNSTVCLPRKPIVAVGLRASTANIFVDNAAYREFLFNTFEVSSVDEESASVVMTTVSNGFPVIVIRGLSDLAGGQPGQNVIKVYGPLAAINTAKVVIQFIKLLP